MYKLFLFLSTCSAFAAGSKLPITNDTPAKIITCYYNTMRAYAPGDLLNIDDIDTSLCIHLFYSLVQINEDASIKSIDPQQDQGDNGFRRFNDLRKKNRHLKTLIVMSESLDSEHLAEDKINNKILTDPNLREKLVNNVVDFVKKYEFNGIELNLSYPDKSDELASDKENFILLLKALRKKFDKEGFILSLAYEGNIDDAKRYDVKEISKYVDFMNLGTFTFHSYMDTDNKVGNIAPIYPSSEETGNDRQLNIDYLVNYWISKGAPPSKLTLGIAFFGNGYTLADPKKIGRGAPFLGETKLSSPILLYSEICQIAKNQGWQHLYDKEQQASYIYKGDQIVACDDVESIKAKTEYVKKMNLAGVSVNSIDADDFMGHCGEKNPLLKTLNLVLGHKC